MTTIPGHNQILPQSTLVQEANQQANAPKPSPDQAQALQQAQQVLAGSSVQDSKESERIKEQKKREEERRRRLAQQAKKKPLKDASELDPDAPGQLLDTTA